MYNKKEIPFHPPFELNKDPKKDGDKYLIKCMKKLVEFPFLSPDSRKIISSISDDKESFQSIHTELLDLWPLVLTDALQKLKEHDSREYDKKYPEMHSFFDPASLGTNELKEVLAGFSEFEGMLYGASPDRYRDHIEHSFRVWIIGQGIIQECFNGVFPDLKKQGITVCNEEWASMWAMVSLCHDIGYPMSHIEKINERARSTLKKQGLLHDADMSFSFSPQMMPFHDTMIKMMASDPVKKGKDHCFTHLQNKYYLKLLKSFDKLDHGIISSLLISRSLVYFLESDFSHDSRKCLKDEDLRQFYIRREILRAIAAHTCQDIYHLTYDNLSMLLCLVDEIQCWGRPTLEQSQHAADNIKEGYAIINKFSAEAIDIRIVTHDDHWDESQQTGVLRQILMLRKMLRLAVDRKDYMENELCFEVCNKGDQKLCLEMKKQSLKLFHNQFEPKAIGKFSKLNTDILPYSRRVM